MKMIKLLLLTIGMGMVIGCNNNTKGPNSNDLNDQTVKNQASSTINETAFGEVDGKAVTLYTLQNSNGMVVKIMNYGGTITSIMAPDKDGNLGDVVLGFDSLAGYLQDGNPFFGCLVGRYANRIAKGEFTLDGKTYTLAKNNNGNSLHGGKKGFDKAIWDSKKISENSIQLNLVSPDGEEGYPGTLSVKVIYSLSDNNELKIDYEASTDKATPINLTNHSYFNLSAGRESTILGHEIMIDANKFTAVDNNLIPTGELPEVKGTSMDFNVPVKPSVEIANVAGGFDHNWVLNKKGDSIQLAATAYDEQSGRYMELYTTQPGVQFYTGNFLNGKVVGKNDARYVKNAGFCLETQHFPDSPNQPSFPNTILRPGETYKETTTYKFGVK